MKAIDDDVEGHKRYSEDDTEGHGGRAKAVEDDDTEGHMYSNPLLNRELAREREREIQRNLQAHATKADASRPHKK